MEVTAHTKVTDLTVEMTAREAKQLYAELYRISADVLLNSYLSAGYERVAELISALAAQDMDS